MLKDPNGREIINSYKKAYDHFSKQFAAAQEKLNSFGGNKKAEGYKEARREYLEAKEVIIAFLTNIMLWRYY